MALIEAHAAMDLLWAHSASEVLSPTVCPEQHLLPAWCLVQVVTEHELVARSEAFEAAIAGGDKTALQVGWVAVCLAKSGWDPSYVRAVTLPEALSTHQQGSNGCLALPDQERARKGRVEQCGTGMRGGQQSVRTSGMQHVVLQLHCSSAPSREVASHTSERAGMYQKLTSKSLMQQGQSS
jgi:hypothetical protein